MKLQDYFVTWKHFLQDKVSVSVHSILFSYQLFAYNHLKYVQFLSYKYKQICILLFSFVSKSHPMVLYNKPHHSGMATIVLDRNVSPEAGKGHPEKMTITFTSQTLFLVHLHLLLLHCSLIQVQYDFIKQLTSHPFTNITTVGVFEICNLFQQHLTSMFLTP